MTNTEPVFYEKCLHCHLFVDDNPAFGDSPGLAEHTHLSRADEADERITDTHEATPSGLIATIDAWKVFGPSQMRERFVVAPA